MEYTLQGLFGVEDDVVVLSGGTGSIGRELSRGLLALGAKVALIGISRELCDTAREELLRDDPALPVHCEVADITDEAAVARAMEGIHRRYGKIDALVNCAGINVIEALDQIDMKDFARVMDVNFTGTVICCKQAGKYMLEAGRGRIVNISSLSAVRAKAYYTAYAASKAAINNFTCALAIEWAKRGINVNAIAPSLIVTDINRKEIEANPESFQKRVASIPRGCPGRAEWLVAPVVALLSPGTVHLTGQCIYVDGGSSAGDTFVMQTDKFGGNDA